MATKDNLELLVRRISDGHTSKPAVRVFADPDDTEGLVKHFRQLVHDRFRSRKLEDFSMRVQPSNGHEFTISGLDVD
jgi:hypothetical protein